MSQDVFLWQKRVFFKVFRGEAAATEGFDRPVSLPAVTHSQKGSKKQGVLETVEQVEEAAVTCKANTHTHTQNNPT